MIPAEFDPIASHIWQSTLFAAAAVLLTFALRRNQARVRYAVLLAASYKFLLPFSWLVSLGRQFEWRTAPAALPHAVSTVTDVISAPAFLIPATDARPVANHLALLPLVIGLVWACGSLIVVAGWMREWLRLRAVVRAATPLRLALPIPVASIPSRLEPGVFGIFRPVLLLPEGIAENLSPAQLRVVLAHELCHVRRRDNLAAALHMLVEAIFWFHPLVWWLDRRIVEERERACDEEVIRMGSDPAAYVETILAICKSYVESPVTCMSGISGSDLKKRVVNVMANRGIEGLSAARKLLLSVLGIVAIVAPIVFGIINAPLLQAQSSDTDWEKAAGGKMSFEVASVKEDAGPKTEITNAGLHPPVRPFSNVPLNDSDVYPPNGGLLSATNWPLVVYIAFAYKLTPVEEGPLMSHLPKWANEERFDIQARASGNVSKNQMRLMMQSLLADRFKLATHEETQEEPVYDLVLEKPGRLGPQLMMRPANAPCTAAAPLTLPDSVPAALAKRITLPVACGTAPRSLPTEDPGAVSWAVGRDFTAAQLAGLLSVPNMANRPVIDKTAIAGRFDFVLYWEPGSSVDAQPEFSAPPFIDALKNQLGLKLVSAKGPVDTFVIDHIEEPTPN